MTGIAPFTLIVPAHNEEAVIARCLNTAMSDCPDPSAMEIIVAANGCSDATAEVARTAAPSAKIIELERGSKTAAINAGLSAASHYPTIILDADIECSFKSLAALAAVLREPDVMTAAPSIRLDLSHGNWFIRAYYSAWMKQPYAKAGKGGAGCYGLSQEALKQIGQFPDIVGDDIWIHTRFSDEQRRMVAQDSDGKPVFSIVRPPATAWQQVKVEARRMQGNAVVKRDYPSPHFASTNQGGGLLGSLRSGASPIHLAVFVGVKLLVRIETKLSSWRGDGENWTRDLSSRKA